MDEEIKLLAHKTVDCIVRKVRRSSSTEFYKFGSNIDIGADGTVTKYVDKIAEDAALSLIEKSKIKVNVLSEEVGFLDRGGKYTFVLDPIDGTRNAYRGIPFYSASLAIGKLKISDIEYGIVKNIPTGDIFTAEKGFGAFYNKNRVLWPTAQRTSNVRYFIRQFNVIPLIINDKNKIVNVITMVFVKICALFPCLYMKDIY